MSTHFPRCTSFRRESKSVGGRQSLSATGAGEESLAQGSAASDENHYGPKLILALLLEDDRVFYAAKVYVVRSDEDFFQFAINRGAGLYSGAR